MAVGKNKKLSKGGKKGGKKKSGDPFLKKEWYDIKAPSMFGVRSCGETLVSRTQGTKIATEELKGRVGVELSGPELGRGPKLPEDQALHRGRAGTELPDGLPRYDDHSRQTELLDPQMAQLDRGFLGCEDHGRLHCSTLRPCIHEPSP